MVKNGNSITTNLVATLDTEEPNGVAISIQDIKIGDAFKKAFEHIIFFPNIYIEYKGYYSRIFEDINKCKIRRYNNYAVSSINVDSKILLGNVLYPLDKSILSPKAYKFIQEIQHTGIVIRFNIGELEITPNRESIIYNTKVKDIIEKRIRDAEQEIRTNITNSLCKDYTNPFDVHHLINNIMYYWGVENEVKETGFYKQLKIYPGQYSTNITYKGNRLSQNDIDTLNKYCSSLLPNIKGIIRNRRMYCTGKYESWRFHNFKYCNSKNIVILSENTTKISALMKSYLIDKYNDHTILNYFTLDRFKEKEYFPSCSLPIVTDIYNAICNRATKIDFSTDTDFLKYKKEQEDNKIKTPTINNVHLYLHSSGYYPHIQEDKCFSSVESAITFLRQLKRTFYLTGLEGMDMGDHLLIRRGIFRIRAAKNVVKALNTVEFNNRLEDKISFLYNDRTLSIIKTMENCKVTEQLFYSDFLNTIPNPLKSELLHLKELYNKYIRDYNINYALRELNIKEDEYTKTLCSKLLDYHKKYISIYSKFDDLGPLKEVNIAFLFMIIKKLNLYRMGYDCYEQINNNELIQLLCKK